MREIVAEETYGQDRRKAGSGPDITRKRKAKEIQN